MLTVAFKYVDIRSNTWMYGSLNKVENFGQICDTNGNDCSIILIIPLPREFLCNKQN